MVTSHEGGECLERELVPGADGNRGSISGAIGKRVVDNSFQVLHARLGEFGLFEEPDHEHEVGASEGEELT